MNSVNYLCVMDKLLLIIPNFSRSKSKPHLRESDINAILHFSRFSIFPLRKQKLFIQGKRTVSDHAGQVLFIFQDKKSILKRHHLSTDSPVTGAPLVRLRQCGGVKVGG